uniref:Uncharacterized protein n=1 Tax=Glossina pallidipes TaxID=7398 RepID=A0A1A9ZLH7_GLOPL
MSNEKPSTNMNIAAAENAGNHNNNEEQQAAAATTTDPTQRTANILRKHNEICMKYIAVIGRNTNSVEVKSNQTEQTAEFGNNQNASALISTPSHVVLAPREKHVTNEGQQRY